MLTLLLVYAILLLAWSAVPVLRGSRAEDDGREPAPDAPPRVRGAAATAFTALGR